RAGAILRQGVEAEGDLLQNAVPIGNHYRGYDAAVAGYPDTHPVRVSDGEVLDRRPVRHGSVRTSLHCRWGHGAATPGRANVTPDQHYEGAEGQERKDRPWYHERSFSRRG